MTPFPDVILLLEVLIIIKLFGLGSLGLVPKPVNTQQIEQSLKVASTALAYRLGVRLFWSLYVCCLLLMYILHLGEFVLGHSWSIGSRLCRNM